MLATAELPGAGFGSLGAFCNFGAVGFLAVEVEAAVAAAVVVFVDGAAAAFAPSLAPIPAAVVLGSRTAPVAELLAEEPDAEAAEVELAFFFFFKVDPADAAVFFVAAFFFVAFFAAGLAVFGAGAAAVVVATVVAAVVEATVTAPVVAEDSADGASTVMALPIAAAALAETLIGAALAAGVAEAPLGACSLLFVGDETAALLPLEDGVGLGGMMS